MSVEEWQPVTQLLRSPWRVTTTSPSPAAVRIPSTLASSQELGWQTELNALLVAHRAEIEESGHLFMLLALYRATGETEKLHEVERKIAEEETYARLDSADE
jgi:hypothetical protein